MQIAVWNEGKEPIEDRDILQPIFIVAPKNAQVVQLSFLKKSRDVTNFHIVDGSSANKIETTWRILEQGDGVILQLFYTGESQAKFSVNGIIKEQRNLSEFTTATAGFNSRFIFRLIVFLFCFAALPSYWILFFFLTRNYAGFYLSLKRVCWQMAAITLVLIATIVFSGYQLFETPLRNSPFGF